jgi:hypothetical protein
MKNVIIFLISLLAIGCQSERIDLNGKFDVALDNRISGVLTLKQEGSKLTGFFQWNTRGTQESGEIYQITGTVAKPKSKIVTVKISAIIGKTPWYTFEGTASDSDFVTGKFIQEEKDKSWVNYSPGRYYGAGKTLGWMAIRKEKSFPVKMN